MIYSHCMKLNYYYSCSQTKSMFFDKPISLWWLLDTLLPTDSPLPVVAAQQLRGKPLVDHLLVWNNKIGTRSSRF